MILTDREIQIAIETQAIFIDPAPSDEAYSSTSVDLTLDSTISEFLDLQDGLDICIDPSRKGFHHESVLGKLTKTIPIGSDGYRFEPGCLILAWTKEFVRLQTQSRLAARVEGKSSLARLGIGVHITAPTVHAGFQGQIRLEMVNHGKIPVILKPGMRICQLILEQTVGTPVQGYKGRFASQTSVNCG